MIPMINHATIEFHELTYTVTSLYCLLTREVIKIQNTPKTKVRIPNQLTCLGIFNIFKFVLYNKPCYKEVQVYNAQV